MSKPGCGTRRPRTRTSTRRRSVRGGGGCPYKQSPRKRVSRKRGKYISSNMRGGTSCLKHQASSLTGGGGKKDHLHPMKGGSGCRYKAPNMKGGGGKKDHLHPMKGGSGCRYKAPNMKGGGGKKDHLHPMKGGRVGPPPLQPYFF